jgi:hypothetical protein
VTGPYDHQPPWGRLPGDPADDDLLELGSDRPPRQLRPSWWPSWRPPRLPRFAAILAVAALAVGVGAGLGVGYTAGQHHAAPRTAAATPSGVSPSAAALAGGPTLAQTGNLCSQQQGTTVLQLGIQVANDSTAPLTLLRVRTVLPMGGLKVVGLGWGPCGELPLGPVAEGDPQISGVDQYLAAQATGWFTVTVKVLGICPSALPVQFQVSYGQHGKISTVPMAGFNDLANVGYSGCPVG